MNRSSLASPFPSTVAHQRGAAGVLFVVSALGLLAAFAMAIDVGRLYNAQRDLQRAANIAALDAVRVTNGCDGHIDDAQAASAANAEVIASLTRNRSQEYLASADGVSLGHMEVVDGFRRFVALGGDDAGTRTAVQVRLERSPPARLIPLTPGTGMTAVASADSRPQTDFSVGSGLASVDGGLLNDLLGGLVGGSLSLDAVHYSGLANSTVTLGELAVAAGLGSVEDFLTTETTLPDVFDTLLNGLGDGEVGAVRDALTALASAADAGRDVLPADVLATPLGLDATSDAALVNVGQLVMALAQSANGINAISLPSLQVNVPGVATVDASVSIIEPPQIAVGVRAGDRSTVARTAQANVQLNLSLLNQDLGVVTTDINIPLTVRLAQATARLNEIRCARRSQPEHEVALDATTSLASIGIGNFADIEDGAAALEPGTIANVTLLGLVGVEVTAAAQVDAGQEHDEPLDFQGPFPSDIQSLGTDPGTALDSALGSLSNNLTLDVATTGTVGVLLQGLLNQQLGDLVSNLTSALAPVLDVVAESALEPLLTALGVSVGNADYQVARLTQVNDPDGSSGEVGDPMSLQAFLFDH